MYNELQCEFCLLLFMQTNGEAVSVFVFDVKSSSETVVSCGNFTTNKLRDCIFKMLIEVIQCLQCAFYVLQECFKIKIKLIFLTRLCMMLIFCKNRFKLPNRLLNDLKLFGIPIY